MGLNWTHLDGQGQEDGGRQAGTPNKITTALQDVILGALSNAGGQAWLVEPAEKNPVAFMALVGRALPFAGEGRRGRAGAPEVGCA